MSLRRWRRLSAIIALSGDSQRVAPLTRHLGQLPHGVRGTGACSIPRWWPRARVQVRGLTTRRLLVSAVTFHLVENVPASCGVFGGGVPSYGDQDVEVAVLVGEPDPVEGVNVGTLIEVEAVIEDVVG